jgi:allantoin racemase
MRIALLVPGTTTENVLAVTSAALSAQASLRSSTVVECLPLRSGIEFTGSFYEDLVLEMYTADAGIPAEANGFDAVVIDSVTDAAMQALRARLSIPVIGSAQASYVAALMLGQRFSVVTTWAGWNHAHERSLASYGLRHKCASIQALYPRDELAQARAWQPQEQPDVLADAVDRALADGADVIVLGSSTMRGAAELVATGPTAALGLPVIDPGAVALKLAETVLSMGLSHSKAAYPAPKELLDYQIFSLPTITAQPTTGTSA